MTTDKTPVMRALIGPFRQSLLSNGRSEMTAKSYASDITMFVNWIEATSTVITLNPFTSYADLAKAYVNEERSVTNANTVIRRMSSIRSFRTYLRSVDGHGVPPIPEPFVNYKGPKAQRASSHPLPDLMGDVDVMVAKATHPSHRVLIGLCGYAGLRISEARSITPRSLFQDHQARWWLAVHGKGGVYREVPVSAKLFAIIDDTPTPSGPDEPYVDMQDRAARQAVTRVATKAGITRAVSSHDLRHTFATTIYRKTKDIRVTQELLGHASSATTEIYTQVTQDNKMEAVTS